MVERGLAELDLTRYVRPGDLVVWGQGSAEPLGLVRRLLEQRAEIGGFRCFTGMSAAGPVRVEHLDHVDVLSYTGYGGNSELFAAGGLDVLPCHYSELPGLLGGALAADVVLLQVPPPDAEGHYSMGLAVDYIAAAAARARTIILEVSPEVPWINGPRLPVTATTVVVHSAGTPVESPAPEPGESERRIAAHVAELVEDGATLQVGMGRLPGAVLSALAGHRDLGIHSGLLGDGLVDLVEAGAVTNARKSLDRGRCVAGLVMGSRKLFSYIDHNPAVELRPVTYTHDPQVLAAQDRLVAINTAIEVDLSGQVNTETIGSRYVGAVGGAVDFARGARRARRGVPIIALPSTAGARSRIVADLAGPASLAGSDVGVVVTEFGVADLRGQPLRVRQERLLAIAHPRHQAELETQLSSWRTIR